MKCPRLVLKLKKTNVAIIAMSGPKILEPCISHASVFASSVSIFILFSSDFVCLAFRTSQFDAGYEPQLCHLPLVLCHNAH